MDRNVILSHAGGGLTAGGDDEEADENEEYIGREDETLSSTKKPRGWSKNMTRKKSQPDTIQQSYLMKNKKMGYSNAMLSGI
jgi:hypothetical protein